MIGPTSANTHYLCKKQNLFFLIILISSIALWSRFHFPAIPGVAWRILLANRLLDGQQIGRDIYEMNTPFSDLLYIAPVLFSRLFHLSASFITYLFTTLYGYLCIYIASLILKYRGYALFQEPVNLNIFRLAFLCGFLFAPTLSFSEREHFIAASLLPYALIKIAPFGFKEAENEPKNSLNFLSCILAFTTILIKPQYALSILIIHCASLYIRKQSYRFKWEFPILASIIILALLAIIFCFPGYIEVFYYVLLSYSNYNHGIIYTTISLINSIIIQLFALILFYKTDLTHLNKHKEFIIALTPLVVASSLAIIAQQKGHEYQKITATIPLWGLVIFNIFDRLQHYKNRIYFIGATLVMLSANYGVLKYYSTFRQSKMIIHQKGWPDRLRKYLHPNDNFICISYDDACPFSFDDLATTYTYSSRYMDLWSTVGAIFEKDNGRMKPSTFNTIFRHDTQNIIDDINRHQPQAIIFVWASDKNNKMRYFSDDKNITAALKHYTLVDFVAKTFIPGVSTWVYVRNSPIQKIPKK